MKRHQKTLWYNVNMPRVHTTNLFLFSRHQFSCSYSPLAIKNIASTEETLEDFEDIDFLILNQNELFTEEKNSTEKLVISEEKAGALDTSAIGAASAKTTNATASSSRESKC